MTCADRRFFVRAGDAWPVALTYEVDDQPMPLDGLSIKLAVRNAAGDVLLSAASPDDRIYIDLAARTVSLAFTGTDTSAWLDGNRSQISLAVAIYDPDDEAGTRRTAVVSDIFIFPALVT
jgi:hypothetical protein